MANFLPKQCNMGWIYESLIYLCPFNYIHMWMQMTSNYLSCSGQIRMYKIYMYKTSLHCSMRMKKSGNKVCRLRRWVTAMGDRMIAICPANYWTIHSLLVLQYKHHCIDHLWWSTEELTRRSNIELLHQASKQPTRVEEKWRLWSEYKFLWECWLMINTITLIIIIQPSTDLYWCILCIQAGDTWNNDRQT